MRKKSEIMNGDLKYQKENIELRRGKVLELLAKGMLKSEIAKTLNVSNALISIDVQYLQETARYKIQNHVEKRIPMQYEECQAGLKLILRRAFEISDKSTKPQEVIAALGLASEIFGRLMDLSTNSAILEKTVKWLEDKKKIMLTPEEEKRMKEVLATTDEDDDEEDDDTSTEKDIQEKE
jgi:hypothetical protein